MAKLKRSSSRGLSIRLQGHGKVLDVLTPKAGHPRDHAATAQPNQRGLSSDATEQEGRGGTNETEPSARADGRTRGLVVRVFQPP